MTWAIPRLAFTAALGLVASLAPRQAARLAPMGTTPETTEATVSARSPLNRASTEHASADDAPTERTSAESEANLLAMVSHDLRTPLTSVKGFAQLLLRDRTASEASRRYAEVILAETNRTIRTIDDVADLARLSEGHDDLEIRSVDLAPVIRQAVESVQHQDVEGRLRLAVPTSLPEVPADAARIERIVTNLVTNALRYSSGSDPLEVGAAGDHEGVEVWVRDSGAGIPIEKFAHVFDLGPASNGHDGAVNGSGLGLYISKRLVEAQGGTIWVEQEAGRGRGFRFRLPGPA